MKGARAKFIYRQPSTDLRGPRQTLTGLLALAVTFSAGIHAALVPEHLDEVPLLGDAFIVAALVGAAIAAALVLRPDNRRIPALAGLFCLGQIAAWVLFVTARVPLFSETPEPIETIALVSKAAEALAILLALRLTGLRQYRPATA
jgi:hypothetical protein